MLSVLMTVYEREAPHFLSASLESVRNQTSPADEVVLIKDGSLTGPLDAVISEYSRRLPLKVIAGPKVGLCEALRVGVMACTGELIARMDSDDLCLPQRLRTQTEALRLNPGVDVVGSAIAEFLTDPSHPHAIRRLPLAHKEIAACAKFRNPMNHVSVMFRRDAVLRAGGYRHAPGFEDWHLWNRMIHAGSRLMNLNETLVLVRVGNGMLKRRSGLQYVKDEVAFHRDMYHAHLLSFWELAQSLLVRVPVRFAPESVLRVVYARALRSQC